MGQSHVDANLPLPIQTETIVRVIVEAACEPVLVDCRGTTMYRAQPRKRPSHPTQAIARLTIVGQRQARLHAGRAGWNLNGDRICRRAAGAARERAGRGHLCLGKC